VLFTKKLNSANEWLIYQKIAKKNCTF